MDYVRACVDYIVCVRVSYNRTHRVAYLGALRLDLLRKVLKTFLTKNSRFRFHLIDKDFKLNSSHYQ